MTDQQPNNLNKQDSQLEVTRPVWLPYNDIAHDLVGALVGQFGYPTSGPKAQKYAVVVASLLKISKWRMRAAALRVVDLCSTEKLVNLK